MTTSSQSFFLFVTCFVATNTLNCYCTLYFDIPFLMSLLVFAGSVSTGLLLMEVPYRMRGFEKHPARLYSRPTLQVNLDGLATERVIAEGAVSMERCDLFVFEDAEMRATFGCGEATPSTDDLTIATPAKLVCQMTLSRSRAELAELEHILH